MTTVPVIQIQSHLSALINNALLDELKPISNINSISQSPKEQYIILEPNSLTDEMVFEKENTQSELVRETTIPFILPIPFP